jgi:hypothetical protein
MRCQGSILNYSVLLFSSIASNELVRKEVSSDGTQYKDRPVPTESVVKGIRISTSKLDRDFEHLL